MKIKKWLLSLVCLLLLSVTSQSFATTTIKNARLWRAPDNTRIVFDLSGPVKYSIQTQTTPNKLIINIPDTLLATQLNNLPLKNTPITGLRGIKQNNQTIQLIFDLSTRVTPKVFTLAPNKPYSHRLVVDLFDNSSTSTAQTQPVATHIPAPPRTISDRRDIIITIDPGHGGEDPGAMGKGGAREKIVVLQIAKLLQQEINKTPGFKAQLTRGTDYFIPLRQRPQLARKMGADLFVSIHADAAPSSAAYGASVFALSQRGATSETARWLADTENQSDLIGGAGSVSLDNKDQVLAGVLIDLSMTAVMSSSLDVGHQVLINIGKITPLHKKRVEQAGFMVLKSPDIPSILVETGFISNVNEARKLTNPSHQLALARAIKTGIVNYFYKNPPPNTYINQLRRGGTSKEMTPITYAPSPKQTVTSTQKPSTHKVVKGDTLNKIAAQYNVTLSALRKANHLTRDTIRTGQILKIPRN